MSKEIVTVPVAAGTLIHIAGVPFTLTEDTMIDGHRGNVAMLRATGALPLPISKCGFKDGIVGE